MFLNLMHVFEDEVPDLLLKPQHRGFEFYCCTNHGNKLRVENVMARVLNF